MRKTMVRVAAAAALATLALAGCKTFHGQGAQARFDNPPGNMTPSGGRSPAGGVTDGARVGGTSEVEKTRAAFGTFHM